MSQITPSLVAARLWRAAMKNEQHHLDSETLLAAVELLRAAEALRNKINGYTGQVYLEMDVTKECAAFDAATAGGDNGQT